MERWLTQLPTMKSPQAFAQQALLAIETIASTDISKNPSSSPNFSSRFWMGPKDRIGISRTLASQAYDL